MSALYQQYRLHNLIVLVYLVLQSYANAVVSSLEDPEKVLEQAVIEMNDDLVKMRQSTAQVWIPGICNLQFVHLFNLPSFPFLIYCIFTAK